MQISPPFGYKEVVPLYKNQKVRLLGRGGAPAFVHGLNAIPISFTEFPFVAREYPIVFTSGDKGNSYAPVAVLGMTTGENLYVDDGRWAERIYIPAYARRFPFCMAKVTLNKVEQQDRLICVEKEYVTEDGESMFDDKGEPVEKWKEMERLLSEFEADLDRSREMCGILSDYGLLEAFTMQATFNQGGAMHLTGMHRVDEKKLEHLNASQIKNLMRKGVMGRIYAHLLSLDNFTRLLDRKAGRAEEKAA
ncbi:MAG: SapC family protein [Betaproteobacteria bacterium]|nr:SapC family protein [Betaproteobacteria bacterium]